MPVITLKLSAAESARLNREAELRGQTKSASLRSLLAERIQTTDDLLRAWEQGELPLMRSKPRKRRAAVA